MALVQRALFKIKPTIFMRAVPKNYSTESSIKKSVFISQSKDIYTNLALQDWIHKNLDLSDHHVLMLWQNEPCVTIGKNENPWLETDVQNLQHITDFGVKLARQKSDGHSMYHDGGNLNMTFFTPKERLNETYNMEIVSRALFREFSLKLDINQHNFVMRGDYNVSRSTQKIGTTNAYHHYSLLVGVNKIDFTQCLSRQEIGIKRENNEHRNASKIMNLCEENPQITVKKLLKAIGWEYLRTHASTIRDGGNQLAHQQKGFQMINPTDSWFPGIANIREKLVGWDWLYGETPDFKVTRTFPIPENVSNHMDIFGNDMTVAMTVSGGIIRNVTLSVPSSLSTSSFNGEADVVTTTLIGRKFSTDLLNNLQDSLKNLIYDKEKFASECRREVMSSF